MDLIYMNADKKDMGVLFDYTLDLAFGSDENNFVCTVDKSNNCCQPGCCLYIEGTEYGGIIDSIKVNTETDTVAYSGRTWHGVLEHKVIVPEEGQDYLDLSGEANEVLSFLIERLGLGGLFSVEPEDSGIEIIEYQMRYEMAYTAIRKMLAAFDGKLKTAFRRGKAVLSAVPRMDYSQDEEWDASQMSFEAGKHFRPVNHLICLGGGDLKDRRVIHLFTDENGGVQPYAGTDEPVCDADYILDTSKQLLFGEDEVAQIYEEPDADVTENYVVLRSKPLKWEKNYGTYYEKDDEDGYQELESTTEEVYTLQKQKPYDWSSRYQEYYIRREDSFQEVDSQDRIIYELLTIKPSDWSSKYKNYFRISANKYMEVEGAEAYTNPYNKQGRKPRDWTKNYGSYYYYYSDGTGSEYRKVSGESKTVYHVQTMKPSDWSTSFKNYFVKIKDKAAYTAVTGTGPKKDKAPVWKAKKYYTKASKSVAPKWQKDKYYTYKQKIIAPVWKPNTYYQEKVQNVPEWAANTYYTKTIETILPEWVQGSCYEKKEDHYAELVKGGMELLKESYNCDEIKVSLGTEENYDVGDIVGAAEETTGIFVWQPITKKIVTIKEKIEEIQYEIGV